MNHFPNPFFAPHIFGARAANWRPLCAITMLFASLGAGHVSVAQAGELDPLQVMRAKGCTACHIIPGIPEANGTMGPSLKDLGKRKRIVARTLSNNEKNLRRWLKNPKAVKSDTMMPNVGLSDEEIDTLIAHFKRP